MRTRRMLVALVVVVVLVGAGVAVLVVGADRGTTVSADPASSTSASVSVSTTEAPSTSTTVTPTTTAAPSTTRQATTAPPATAARPRGLPGVAVRVTKVVDGDTIHISTGVTVRIIGLDTPETKHPSKPVQCYGPQASDQAHRLLDGVTVHVETEPAQGIVDKYGRSLFNVWLPDGRLYSEVMIAHGYAHYYVYDAPLKYAARLSAAQDRARQRKEGFWSPSTCNGNTDAPAGVPRSTSPVPPSQSGGSSGSGGVSYPNCAAARAAGAAPIQRGSPGYSSRLDGDGDGIACE